MGRDLILPKAPEPAWWERYTAAIEVEWHLTPGALTLREWLFSHEGELRRQYKGYRCFWLRGSVRILGLFIGAAVFLRAAPMTQGEEKGR